MACGTLAQQNDNWHFGHFATIDFSSGVAVPGSGPLEALEGTACVSDANGDVLFYTEGTTVWDRNNAIMPNGSGLTGGSSSTQAALIVPKPGACGIYYVFTTQDHFGNGAFRYSVVDMCLNNGNGDVVAGEKNILIATPCGEKITAVPHDNGTDYWVITHELGGDAFLAFQLTPSGLVMNPVSTSIGSAYAANCMIGPLKASHNGEHLICQSTFCNICEMFDFDASTGIVSNAVNLVSQYSLPGGFYGVEFSPSDDRLYLATTWVTSRLYQIDLTTSTLTQLQSIPGNYMLGALQLAPDGRIYLARTNQPFVDVITDPEVSGTGCNYTQAGLALLPGTTSDVGLPCMIPASIMQPIPTVVQVELGPDTSFCNAVSFTLMGPLACGGTHLWQDGSSQSTFVVDAPGTYWLDFSSACGTGSDTLVVSTLGNVFFDLGEDTVLCSGAEFDLQVPTNVDTVLWQDGSTAGSYTVTGAGTFWAVVTSSGCTGSDTIAVVEEVAPTVTLDNDTLICAGTSIELTATTINAAWLQWSNGGTTATITVVDGGTYSIEVGNACGSDSDSIMVSFAPRSDPLPDAVICGSALASIGPGASIDGVLWNTGETTNTIQVPEGTYWFSGTDGFGCEVMDTLEVVFVPGTVSAAWVPNVISPNGDGLNDLFTVVGGAVTDVSITIFDRWGMKMYAAKNGAGWNGKVDNTGADVPDGTYYYLVEHRNACDGAAHSEHGVVTLMR